MKKIKLFLTAITFIVIAKEAKAQMPAYVPKNGLKAWYGFNGNANDLSENGNILTVNGSPYYINDRYGNSTYACYFPYSISPQSMFRNPFNLKLNKDSNFTVSFWLKPNLDSMVSTSPKPILTIGNANSGYNLFIYFNSPSNYLSAQFGFGTTADTVHYSFTGNWYYPNSLSKIDWSNIIVTWDHLSGLRLYINGVMVFYNPAFKATTSPASSNSLNIVGGIGQTSSFSGGLDDIGIWNRQLISTEIDSIYKGGGTCLHFSSLPQNATGSLNKNCIFTSSHLGNYDFLWQSNPIGFGWQNVSNSGQYSGAKTSNLTVSNLSYLNYNQQFRLIASKGTCIDTSNIVKILLNNVADSLALKNANDSINKLNLQYANKHDTLYVSSSVSTDTLKIYISTGISGNSLVINSIKVHPNPAATLLQIDLQKPGYYTARLSGLSGQTLITPTSGSIDITGLTNGVYILSIYDNLGKLISTNKVMIAR